MPYMVKNITNKRLLCRKPRMQSVMKRLYSAVYVAAVLTLHQTHMLYAPSSALVTSTRKQHTHV